MKKKKKSTKSGVKLKNSKKKLKPILAHGAVKPVVADPDDWESHQAGRYIRFGATLGPYDYPVVFRFEQIPDLIEWLQEQVKSSEA